MLARYCTRRKLNCDFREGPGKQLKTPCKKCCRLQDAENDLVYRLHDSLQRLEAAVEHIDARVKDLEGVVVPIRNYLEASKEGAAAGENANQTVDVDAQLKLVEASGIWFTANSEQVAEPEVVVPRSCFRMMGHGCEVRLI